MIAIVLSIISCMWTMAPAWTLIYKIESDYNKKRLTQRVDIDRILLYSLTICTLLTIMIGGWLND